MGTELNFIQKLTIKLYRIAYPEILHHFHETGY